MAGKMVLSDMQERGIGDLEGKFQTEKKLTFPAMLAKTNTSVLLFLKHLKESCQTYR